MNAILSSTTTTTTTTMVPEEERREYLDRLQRDTTLTMIPAMVFLIVLAVTGLIGNSLVLFVYSQKFSRTSTRIFIMAMASCDLVANVVSIPGEIYDMFHIWDFNHPDFCKARLFLASFTTLSSAMILLAVAVVRYRKVCTPYGWQITVKHARIVSIVIVCLGFIFSIPYAIINGRQTKETPRPGIYGYECTTDDSYVDTVWPMINNGFFLFLFCACCIPFVVIYIRIGIKAWEHGKLHGASNGSMTTTRSWVSTSSVDERAKHRVTTPEPEVMPKPSPLPLTRIRKKKSVGAISFGSIADVMDEYDEEIRNSDSPERSNVRFVDDSVEIRSPIIGDFSFRLEGAAGGETDDDFNGRRTAGAEAENRNTSDLDNVTNFQDRGIAGHRSGIVNNACDANDECQDAEDATGRRGRYDVRNDHHESVVTLRGQGHSKGRSEVGKSWPVAPPRNRTKRYYYRATTAGVPNTSNETTSTFSADILKAIQTFGEEGFPHDPETLRSKSGDTEISDDFPDELKSTAVKAEQPRHSTSTNSKENRKNKCSPSDSEIRTNAAATSRVQREITERPGKEFDTPLTGTCKEKPYSSQDVRSSSHENGTQRSSGPAVIFTNSPDEIIATYLNEGFRDDTGNLTNETRHTHLSDANGNAVGKCDSDAAKQSVNQAGSTNEGSDQTGFRRVSSKLKNFVLRRTSDKQTASLRSSVRRRPLGRTTAMLIIISAIYVIGFLPYLALSFFKFSDPERFKAMTHTELFFYNLFLRTFFLNCAANPVIYGLCDINFRRECANLFRCWRTR